MQRIIAHLDMDAFFAAVEERDNPRFKGLPIVIGADPKGGVGRGVVSTSNYAARKYGIRSAMPISKAWNLAKAGAAAGGEPVRFLGVDMAKYSEESRTINELIVSLLMKNGISGENIYEQASIDEAYMDLSGSGSFDKAVEIARNIKRAIRERRGLTASVGIGSNKLIAKIASDKDKPDGLIVVHAGSEKSFLAPLGIRAIPGIGPKTEQLLLRKGFQTVGELADADISDMEALLGKHGLDLHAKANGEDEMPLESEWTPKSVGDQETFEIDTLDPNELTSRLKELADKAFRRFKREGFSTFRTVVVTVRFSGFITKNRSSTLKEPASTKEGLEYESLRLFMPFLDARENPKRLKIRLLGVRMEKLD